MARPKADLPSAASLMACADDQQRLAVRVTPGARSETIAIAGGQICIKVRAKPQDGAANDAVISLLAKALGGGRSKVELLRGATSRMKLFQIG